MTIEANIEALTKAISELAAAIIGNRQPGAGAPGEDKNAPAAPASGKDKNAQTAPIPGKDKKPAATYDDCRGLCLALYENLGDVAARPVLAKIFADAGVGSLHAIKEKETQPGQYEKIAAAIRQLPSAAPAAPVKLF